MEEHNIGRGAGKLYVIGIEPTGKGDYRQQCCGLL
jgi:hypothetical protein